MENAHTSQVVATLANTSPVLRTVVVDVCVFFSIFKFLALLRCFGRGLTEAGADEQVSHISNQQEKDKERGEKKEEKQQRVRQQGNGRNSLCKHDLREVKRLETV